MGQGGRLVLKNFTPYRWRRVATHSYQLELSPPEYIEANTVASVYVEYCETIFKHWEDDAGEVTYAVECSGSPSFEVAFSRPNNVPTVRVNYKSLSTVAPQLGAGSVLDIGGWQHDGEMVFALMGSHERGFAVADGSNYMQAFIAQGWGDRTLRQICIGGSHDAGMYEINGGTAFGNAANTQTQVKNILGQLQMGARFLDIRPVITGGKYATGHYGRITGSTQGANGGWMDRIVADINRFTATSKELVVVKLSHSLNTDVGQPDYREFTTAEWTNLFKILKGLNGLVKKPAPIDFTTQTLASYIGTGRAAVVVLVDGTNATCDTNQGFFKMADSTFPVYDNYSDTDSVGTMMSKQLNHFNENHPYFLLSWTMTQQGVDTVMGPSILELARKANKMIPDFLRNCTPTHIPNIFYIDRVTNESPFMTNTVVDINKQFGSTAVPVRRLTVEPSVYTLGTPPSAEAVEQVLTVRSAGFNVGNRASFVADGVEIKMAVGRGLNLVVLDSRGCRLTTATFDTYEEPSASAHFASLVDCLPTGTVVAIAVMDEATKMLTERAIVACTSLGSTMIRNLKFRGSWAMIGVKGGAAIVEEVLNNGPVMVSAHTPHPQSPASPSA